MIYGYSIWQILGVISIVVLLFSFWSKNSIWGGLTGGGLIGVIAAFFKEGSYNWYYVAKFAIVGVLIGLFADILSRIGKKIKS